MATGDSGAEDALGGDDMGGDDMGGMDDMGGAPPMGPEEDDVDEDVDIDALMRELEGIDETPELDEMKISAKKHGSATKGFTWKGGTTKALKEDDELDENKYGWKRLEAL